PIPGSAIRRNRARCLQATSSSSGPLSASTASSMPVVQSLYPLAAGAVTVRDRITDRSVAAVLPASSHKCPRGRGSLRPAQHIDDPCAGGGLDLATRAELPEISSAAVACLSSLTS